MTQQVQSARHQEALQIYSTFLWAIQRRPFLEGNYTSALASDWSSIKVWALDPDVWKLPVAFCKSVTEAQQTDGKQCHTHSYMRLTIGHEQLDKTKEASNEIKKLAKSFHENVPLRPLSDFEFDR